MEIPLSLPLTITGQAIIERQAREPLRRYIAHMVDVSARRISLGENNIKGHLFLSAVSAQIDAMERGEDPDPLILEAARNSAVTCYGLFKARIRKPPSSIVVAGSEEPGLAKEEGSGASGVNGIGADAAAADDYEQAS